MKRLKSIDTIRGLSICWMIYGHLSGWWLTEEDHWVIVFVRQFGDFLGSGAFLLISGIATALSYHNRCKKAELSDDYNMQIVRNEYIFRAFFIFVIALCYNSLVAIQIMDPTRIWSWFILMTIAFSLLIAWPLLSTPKWFRLIIATGIWILNQYIFTFLLLYQGQSNIQGILFHFLYNSPDLDPILAFFTFFIVGTVIGDIIFEIYQIDDKSERQQFFKRKFLIPSLISGGFLITLGVLIEFPNFLQHRSLSWLIYSLGMVIVLLSILLSIEEFEVIKSEKSYRFFYYFSYYSFTIFLAHNLLYFIFLHQLNWFTIWFFIGGTIVLLGFLLKAIYNSSWRTKASVKIQIGRLAQGITMKIEKKKKLSS